MKQSVLALLKTACSPFCSIILVNMLLPCCITHENAAPGTQHDITDSAENMLHVGRLDGGIHGGIRVTVPRSMLAVSWLSEHSSAYIEPQDDAITANLQL